MKLAFKTLKWIVIFLLAVIILINLIYILRITLTDWSEAAKSDIEAWHQLIQENHPGPVDKENPLFISKMNLAYREALNLADKVESSAGYRWALARYEAIFDDPHLTGIAFGTPSVLLERIAGTYEWPGFYASLSIDNNNSKSMLVHTNGGGFKIGEKIISCDGKAIDKWLDETTFAFRGAGIKARAQAASPWLFTIHGNPFIEHPSNCVVEQDNRSRNLIWTTISASEWKANVPYRKSNKGTFDYSINDVAAWIKIPSFANSHRDSLQKISDKINTDADRLQSSPLIIFDLRGNGGGNSAWGRRISDALWSAEYVNAHRLSGAKGIDWRISDDNIAHVQSIANKALANGNNSAQYWNSVVDRMISSQSNGELFYQQKIKQRKASKDVNSPIAGQVVVLIDSACFSACLDFLDLVSMFDNVKFVGQETGADTNYIEVRRSQLPGFRFSAITPIKVYRGRIRPNNGSYLPHITWPENVNLSSDREIESWLSEIFH